MPGLALPERRLVRVMPARDVGRGDAGAAREGGRAAADAGRGGDTRAEVRRDRGGKWMTRAVLGARREPRDWRNDPIRGTWGQARDRCNDPICGSEGQTRGPSNDPLHGAWGQARDRSNDPKRGLEGQTRRPSNDPIRGTWGQARDRRNDPIRGSEGQARHPSNDPIRGAVVWARGTAGRLRMCGWRPGGGTKRVRPPSGRLNLPGWARLRGGGDEAPAAGGSGAARQRPYRRSRDGRWYAVTRGPMRWLALGDRTAMGTREPSVAERVAMRFGPTAVDGGVRAPLAPRRCQMGVVRNDPIRGRAPDPAGLGGPVRQASRRRRWRGWRRGLPPSDGWSIAEAALDEVPGSSLNRQVPHDRWCVDGLLEAGHHGKNVCGCDGERARGHDAARART